MNRLKPMTISEFREAMRRGKYTWPGSYPLYFVMADGAALSFEAARENRRLILEAIAHGHDEQWLPLGLQVNWEDQELYCADSNRKIKVAYGEED